MSSTVPVPLKDDLQVCDPLALASRCEEYRWHLQRIVRFRMSPALRRRVDVDDVLQEVYLAARQRLGQWNAGVPVCFLIWLRSIALQTIQNLHRFHLGADCRSLLNERPLAVGELFSSEAGDQLLASLTSPSQKAIQHETLGMLDTTLRELSGDDRNVIALRHFEGLSNSEVAEVLQITAKTASIRYVRALDRLRRKMDSIP